MLLPEGDTIAFPVTTSVPRLAVIAFPVGKAVLPIATATLPVLISSSGSLAATIVNCESPDIEKVPIDDVKPNDPASANPPTCPAVDVRPTPVTIILKSVVPTACPTDEVPSVPVNE